MSGRFAYPSLLMKQPYRYGAISGPSDGTNGPSLSPSSQAGPLSRGHALADHPGGVRREQVLVMLEVVEADSCDCRIVGGALDTGAALRRQVGSDGVAVDGAAKDAVEEDRSVLLSGRSVGRGFGVTAGVATGSDGSGVATGVDGSGASVRAGVAGALGAADRDPGVARWRRCRPGRRGTPGEGDHGDDPGWTKCPAVPPAP